jgi:hypothetical protein
VVLGAPIASGHRAEHDGHGLHVMIQGRQRRADFDLICGHVRHL